MGNSSEIEVLSSRLTFNGPLTIFAGVGSLIDKHQDINVSHLISRVQEEEELGRTIEEGERALGRPALEFRIFNANLSPEGIRTTVLATLFAAAFTQKWAPGP